MILYLLYHKRFVEEDVYYSKIIGIYSSYERVSNTIQRYLTLPGFSEFPQDFYIESFNVQNDGIHCLMHKKDRVFLLQYLCSASCNPEEDDEDAVIFGIYPTKFAAILAQRKVRKNRRRIKKTEKVDLKLHFYIDKYIINEDNWAEGFVVITE